MSKCIVVLLVILWWVPPAQAEVRRLFILHTNDFHGRLEPFPDKSLVAPPGHVGGAAYLAGEIDVLERVHPHSLLLDAGDIAQGTAASNLSFGMADVDFLNVLPYDARTIGNHEFDWGQPRLQAMVDRSKAPIVCANLVDLDGRLLPHVRPYVVTSVDGVKVGILGLITTDTPKLSFPGNVATVRFLDPADTVRKYLPRMRQDGAQVVVLLTHLGVDADEKLARDVPGIDAIVGGHSHTALSDGRMVGHTIIVQGGCYGRYVGTLELDYDTDQRQVVSERCELTPIVTAMISPDAKVQAVVRESVARVGPRIARQVGQLAEDLPVGDETSGESPLGDVVCDAVRQETGADVACYNHGGLRASLLAGPVKWGDVFSVLPFDNHVMTVTLTGAQLKALLTQGVPLHIQVSGVTFEVDGQTVRNVQVGGAALSDSASYRVATIDFMILGGDGYTVLAGGTQPTSGRLVLDVMVDYLRRHPDLRRPPADRIHVVRGGGGQAPE
ncbi:MAG TPA: bifunctional UDP-sugar hydrolase/5'-nucleotidase [Candidatus Xenobia bacterium]|jgi:2',3'-cyclic-nucleotide 2'-phosphodiesterase (5'-nucleotidase family)